MLAKKTSHFCEITASGSAVVLIFNIYGSFYINNLVLKNPEASDATPYNTNRVSVTGSNHANSGARPLYLRRKLSLPRKSCLPRIIKRNTPVVDRAGAGKWLEPTAKGQDGDEISCKLQNNSNVYYTHKSQVIDSYATCGNTSSAERAKNSPTMQLSAIYCKTTP